MEAELALLLRRERVAAAWTQGRLARGIGVSQSLVCRYERLTALRPRVDIYARAFEVLEVAVSLEARHLREPRRRDRGHAFVLAYVLRRLPQDWLTDAEVAVRAGRRSGWIDLLLFRPQSRTLLVVEIKTEAENVGEIVRTLRWHADQALAAAYQRRWRPRTVIPVLVVLMTRDAVARLVEARRVLAAAFPGEASALLDLLHADAARPAPSRHPGGYVVLVDPRSKRKDWLAPLPGVGRPPRLRWQGYADFARDIESRRIRRPPMKAIASPDPTRR